MENFSFQEMQAIQKELQDKYKDKWHPLSPEKGNYLQKHQRNMNRW